MDIKEYISSGIIESYVLGLATEQESSLLECVRKNHPEVEEAILETQVALEDLATIQAIAPAEYLKEDIWSKIQHSEENTSPQVSNTEVEEISEVSTITEEKTPVIRSLRTNLSIAASVLLAVSVGANIYLYRDNTLVQENLVKVNSEKKQTENRLAEATERWDIINKPTVKSVLLLGAADHSGLQAKVLWDTEKKGVYLIADQLPQAPEGMQYQLWAIVDGKPVDAGLVPLTGGAEMYSMQTIASAQAFAITMEKAGGSPVPTLSELRVIGNI